MIGGVSLFDVADLAVSVEPRPARYVALTTLLVVLATTFAGQAAAVSDHRIHLDDGEATVEITFEVYGEDPDSLYQRWTTSITVPSSAEIRSVRDSQGEVESYSRNGDQLSVESNTGPLRSKEVFTVEYSFDATVESHGEFTVVELDLVGFRDSRDDVPDEVTQARITAEDDVLSWSPAPGFRSGHGDDGLVFRGEGSASVRVVVGENDDVHDHYTVSGDQNLLEADDLYSTVPAALGFAPPVASHPVVVLSDDRYEEEVNPWSAGQHRTGGLIFLRESLVEDGDYVSTLLHETTHTYNAFAFSWSRKNPAWFDEGTSQYVEFLVDRQRGEVRSELFGEERREPATCPDGSSGCVRRLPPRGDADELWRYHRDDETRMETWTSEDHRQRGFGYAFSELAMREYVLENGGDALHPVYSEIGEREERVRERQQASDVVLETMEYDLRPCDEPTRQEFETCIDSVNSMDAVVPGFQGGDRETVRLEEIEMPEPEPREPGEPEQRPGATRLVAEWFSGFFDWLRSLFAVAG